MATFRATLHARDPDSGYFLRRFSIEGHSWLAGESEVVEKAEADYLATVRNGAAGPLAFSIELESGSLEEDPSFERYTETLISSSTRNVQAKGGRDQIVIHAAASSEGAAHFPGEEVVDLTDPGIDGGGQIFRASSDSVHSVILRFEALGLTVTEEDFESYADTAALRAAWTASDLAASPHFLDAIVFADGGKSMRLDLKKNASDGDSWAQAFSPAEDWTGVEAVRFEARVENREALSFGIRVSDGVNSATAPFELTASLAWEAIVLPIGGFAPDGAAPPDYSAITSGAIVCLSCAEDGSAWFDGLRAVQDPGPVDVEIYEVDGPTPAALGAQIGETISVSLRNVVSGLLEAQMRTSGLIFGSYYAILVSGSSNAKLLGATQDGYENGHAFSLAGAVVTPILGSALSFVVSSDVPAKLDHIRLCFDADPGDAGFSAWIVRASGLLSPLIYNVRIHGEQSRMIELPTSALGLGDLLFIEVEDDEASAVTHWALETMIRHEPFPSWG